MSQPAPLSSLPLQYLVRAPQLPPPPGAKAPLLLLLHGVGSNEQDLFGLASQLDPRFLILSLRAPLTRAPGSYAWFDVRFLPEGFAITPEHLKASRDVVVEFIREAVRAYDADPERVYLLGFSQGAIVSLTLALTAPRVLAGVVALAGRIPPEVLPWRVAPEQTAGLPVLIEHGTADSVIPIDWAHRARPTLEEQRVALTYHEYPAPHTITPAMLRDAIGWLEERLAAPPPWMG